MAARAKSRIDKLKNKNLSKSKYTKGYADDINPEMFGPNEWISDEKQLSNDPKALISQCKKLISRTIQAHWLIGQRLAKLKKLHQAKKVSSRAPWEEYGPAKVGISRVWINKYIALYLNYKYKEIVKMNIEPTKMLEISTLKNPEQRSKLIKYAEKPDITVKQLKEKISKQKAADKEMKKVTQVTDKKVFLTRSAIPSEDQRPPKKSQQHIAILLEELSVLTKNWAFHYRLNNMVDEWQGWSRELKAKVKIITDIYS